MKLLLLASGEQRAELLHGTASDIEWTWLQKPATVEGRFDACIDFQFEPASAHIAWLRSLDCGLVVINAVEYTTAETGDQFVRFNGWNTFIKRPVAEVAGSETHRGAAQMLFQALGKQIMWVPDICGMITPRIVAGIINEAFFSLAEGVSSRDEIDTAMKLGTNYPYGPFEWASLIGHQKLFTLLMRLSSEEIRYQPSSLLQETALA